MIPFARDPETAYLLALLDRERAFQKASLRQQAREARRGISGSPHSFTVVGLLSAIAARLRPRPRCPAVLEGTGDPGTECEAVIAWHSGRDAS